MAHDLIEVARGTKYPPGAFEFVQRGLEFTVNRIHGKPKTGQEPVSRHISGKDLCLGLRDYALSQYGLLARMVLRRWQITSCLDFGHIVFAMVDAGLMHKTQDDTLADFEGVFDFAQAFTTTLDRFNRSQ